MILYCFLYIIRAYGIKDNPKKTLEERGSFLAGDLRSFINLNNLKTKDIWESEDHSLWKAKLYPVVESQEKAVSWAFLLHRMSSEKADEVKVAEWKSLKRYSLEESFQIADASVLVPWEEKLENRILIERFLNRLRAGEHYVDSLKTFGIQGWKDGLCVLHFSAANPRRSARRMGQVDETR